MAHLWTIVLLWNQCEESDRMPFSDAKLCRILFALFIYKGLTSFFNWIIRNGQFEHLLHIIRPKLNLKKWTETKIG
jgi:hypothetical protein